ncbi:hypothetical protein HYC85_002659, partial [Camellia sinensis]
HAQQLLPAGLTVVTGAIPTRIIFLTASETTKAATFRLVEPFKLSEPTQAAIANGVAGMAAAVVCSQAVFLPIDVMCQPCSYLKVIISWVRTEHEESAPSLWTIVSVQAAGGIFAGAAASCITTPLDIIKTRLQVMGPEKKHTLGEVVKGLIVDDGWKGSYGGLGPRFFPMSAWGTSMILSYEYLKCLCVKDQ